MKFLTKIGYILDRTYSLLALMAAIILVLLMLSVSYTVVTRYVLGMSTPWLFEIWEYCILYIPFLGGAWLLRREGHVSVDIAVTHLKPRAKAVLGIITSLIGSSVCLGLTWYGAQATLMLFEKGYRIPGEIYPPQFLIVMIIPIGSFLLLIQFLRRTYGFIRQSTAYGGR